MLGVKERVQANKKGLGENKMIFGKAKKAESAEGVPIEAYVRNEKRNMFNTLVFTPEEAYNPPVIYGNNPTIRMPGSEYDKKEFDSIEHIVDSSKMTIPIHVCGRKLAKHRVYNEDSNLALVPTDLREEGISKFFERIEDTVIHYRMKGYNIKIVNGINDSAYEPIESAHFNAIKKYLGIGLDEKVK